MNKLFYNIAGGIVHRIRRENGETLSKIGIGFISNFLLKAQVLDLTVLKRKNLSLLLKVETDQFVICLVVTRVSFCQNLLHFTLDQGSES